MSSNYVRQGRYLVPRSGSASSNHGCVRRVKGKHGQTVMRLGPSFAEDSPVEADPRGKLLAELETLKPTPQRK